MITNTFVTLIKMTVENKQNTYKVYGTYPAHFEETKGINTNRSSRERTDIDKVTVYIPEVLRDIEVEDIIIRNPDKTEIQIQRSLKEFQDKYEAYIITSSDVFDFGSPSMRHTRIGGN